MISIACVDDINEMVESCESLSSGAEGSGDLTTGT